MTNAMIIWNAEQELAEAGKIRYTGKTFEAEDAAGNKVILKETEAIHTYQTRKALGYQVQKGQKAIAQIRIWKHTVKHIEDTDRDETKMFMKTAHFFSEAQVEKIA